MNINVNYNQAYQDAENWAKALRSSRKEGDAFNHPYVVRQGEHFFEARNKTQFDSQTHKLAVDSIVHITKDKFNALASAFNSTVKERNLEETRQYVRLSADLTTYTNEIISIKEHKRERIKWKFLIVIIICACTIIGIPLALILSRNLRRFNDSIYQLKLAVWQLQNNVSKIYPDPMERFDRPILRDELGYSDELILEILKLKESPIEKELIKLRSLALDDAKQVEFEQALQYLSNYIDQIQDTEKKLNLSFSSAEQYVQMSVLLHSETLPTVNSDEHQEECRLLIEKIYREKWESYHALPPDQKPKVMPQFQLDIERFCQFKRKDFARQINDHHALPSLESENRVSDAQKAIEELFQKDPETGAFSKEDQDWINALQLAVTQTAVDKALGYPRVAIQSNAINVSWKEEDKFYYLTTDFANHQPPVELEVIRDEQSGSIRKVHLSVEGCLNMLKAEDSLSKDKVPLIENAVAVTMNCTLTLDKKGGPQISDLKCMTTTTIPLIIKEIPYSVAKETIEALSPSVPVMGG